MKLVVDPSSLVGLVVGLVVENALPFHFVMFPVPVVKASILIVKLPSAMPHPVQLVPLVPASYFEMFLHVLRLNI